MSRAAAVHRLAAALSARHGVAMEATYVGGRWVLEWCDGPSEPVVRDAVAAHAPAYGVDAVRLGVGRGSTDEATLAAVLAAVRRDPHVEVRDRAHQVHAACDHPERLPDAAAARAVLQRVRADGGGLSDAIAHLVQLGPAGRAYTHPDLAADPAVLADGVLGPEVQQQVQRVLDRVVAAWCRGGEQGPARQVWAVSRARQMVQAVLDERVRAAVVVAAAETSLHQAGVDLAVDVDLFPGIEADVAALRWVRAHAAELRERVEAVAAELVETQWMRLDGDQRAAVLALQDAAATTAWQDLAVVPARARQLLAGLRGPLPASADGLAALLATVPAPS